MIKYTLQCQQRHRFEGWFASSAGFEQQVAAGAVCCPICGDDVVTRAPMAPRILRHQGAGPAQAEPVAAEPPSADQAPSVPAPAPAALPQGAQAAAAMAAMVQRVRALRAVVEATCDNVGDRFPEEARRIHYGETERRNIYGEATREEADALHEEGVDVALIPWVPRDN